MAEAAGGANLVQVVTLLGAMVVAVPLFKRLGLDSVLGYIAAGLVIGPFGLQLIGDPLTILHVAELGVVMFLFVIGLEMKPSHLWSLRGQIFGLGSAQILTSIAVLTGVGIAFGFSWQVSFICGAGFVLTSTAIVMKILGERGDINQPRGQKMVSILLFEDLLIVPLLAIVAFLSPADAQPRGGGEILTNIGIAAASLAALIAAGLWLLNPLFRVLANARAREVMTAAALLVVLGAALLMELGGLSMAMGAFVAGVLLSESSFRHQVADIEPFRGLLLGLFFIAVGMALDLAVVAQNWPLIAGGVVAMMLGKGLCIYAVARLLKSPHDEALDRAILMAQGGEFAFVLYQAAVAQGVISGTVNANMTAIIVLSMVLTPLVVMVYRRFHKAAAPASLDGIEAAHDLRGNVLVIGFGRVGQVASQPLLARGATISIIDTDPDVIRDSAPYGFKVYYGDGAREDVLHAAGAQHADVVLVCVDKPEIATRIVENLREHCPGTKVVVRAFDRRHSLALVKAGADVQVRETLESALVMGREAIIALGESELDADEAVADVRRRDGERFALEVAGLEFEGRKLLTGNVPRASSAAIPQQGDPA